MRGSERTLGAGFTGNEDGGAETVILHWRYGNKGVMFSVVADEGEYYYTFGEWSYTFALRAAELLDDGIQYAKDWLDYPYDEPIDVMINTASTGTEADGTGLLGIAGIPSITDNTGFCLYQIMAKENVYNPIYTMTCVHEAVHVLLTIMKNNGVISRGETIKLNEGLCEAITYQYIIDKQYPQVNQYYLGVLRQWERWAADVDSKYSAECSNIMDVYNAIKQTSDDQVVDFYALVQAQAISFIAEIDENTINPQPMNYLNHYKTAQSFVMFLLDKGGKEDFMAAFGNYRLMGDIYGNDRDGLINEWLENLANIIPKATPHN